MDILIGCAGGLLIACGSYFQGRFRDLVWNWGIFLAGWILLGLSWRLM